MCSERARGTLAPGLAAIRCDFQRISDVLHSSPGTLTSKLHLPPVCCSSLQTVMLYGQNLSGKALGLLRKEICCCTASPRHVTPFPLQALCHRAGEARTRLAPSCNCE